MLAAPSARARLWPLLVLAIGLGLALLLSAVQTLPFAEYFALSQRADKPGFNDPLPPAQLLTLIVPTFFGSPLAGMTYRGVENFNAGVIYAGLPALVLACLAPLGARRLRVYCLLLLLLCVVYIVVGGPGIEALGAVPALRSVSLRRTAFLLPLLVAVLAAQTLSAPKISFRAAAMIVTALATIVAGAVLLDVGDAQAHLSETWPALTQAGLGLSATLGLLALRQRVATTRLVDFALVLLAWLDLYLVGGQYNPSGPVDQLMLATPSIAFLHARAVMSRVAIFQLADQAVPPNLLTLYDLSEAGGYSSLAPGDYYRLVNMADPKSAAPASGRVLGMNDRIVFFSRPTRRLLELLNVNFVLTPGPPIDAGVRSEIDHDGCSGDSGQITAAHPVSGTFVVRENAINRLDLRMRVYEPARAGGSLLVRLWEGITRERLVLDTRQDTSALLDRQVITFYFAPEREAPGHAYTWEVAPGGPQAQTGVGLCTRADDTPAFAIYGLDWSEVYRQEFRVYERQRALPRAYVVYAAERVGTESQALTRVLDESFDLRNRALSIEPLDLPVSSDVPATPAEIVALQSNQVRIHATAQQKGLLVLADQYYPGWRAWVDGQPAEIIRVNYLQRGVSLPAGAHEIVFEFMPDSLRYGMLLSVLGVAFGIILTASGAHPAARRWLNLQSIHR